MKIQFTFCLEKDENIPGEFPYRSLGRTCTVTLLPEELKSSYFKKYTLEEFLIKCVEARKDLLAGLAMENDYDRILIESWKEIADMSNSEQEDKRSVATKDQ